MTQVDSGGDGRRRFLYAQAVRKDSVVFGDLLERNRKRISKPGGDSKADVVKKCFVYLEYTSFV